MTGQARRILLNTTYRVVADVIAKAASVALYIVMARQLGTFEFGVFAFGLSLVTLVTAFADFGQDRILTREVARDHAKVHHYFANTLALKLVLAIPALAIALAVLWAVAEPKTTQVAALLGVAVVAEQLMATCFATFQSYERMVFIPAALITQRILMAGFGIAALLAGVGVVTVAAIYLVTAVIGLGVALVLLFVRVVRPRLSVTPGTWRALMVAAFPIGAAGVFAVVLSRADMAMLAGFESHAEVGEYAASYRLFETTLFLSWGVGAAVYPVLSRLSLTSLPPVGLVFERGMKLLVALTLPLAVGAAVLAEPVVDLLYGEEFADSALALVLLAPAIAVYPVGYVASYLLVSQDRQRLLVPIYAGVALQNILFNLVLIPAYSLYGAAAGTSISLVLLTGALVLLCVRLLGTLGWVRILAGPALASAVAGLTMVLLAGNFAAAVTVGALVYLGVLVVFERRVFPEDARTITDLLSRRT